MPFLLERATKEHDDMSETTATVDTAAPAAPQSIREHYEAAKSAQSTMDHDAAGPTSGDTPDTPPAEETDKAADQPAETAETEDTQLLTKEELAALSPKDRANAEKWQARLTQKSQAIAAQSREFEEWKGVAQALKSNPVETLQELAKANGWTMQQVAKDAEAAKTITESAMAELPEELQFMKPYFDAAVKQAVASMRSEIAPLKESHARMAVEASARETEAVIAAFGAKHPGWEKYESAMTKLGEKLQPNGMDEGEYMETLYHLASRGDDEARKTAAVVKKMENAAKASEPSGAGVPAARVEHVMPQGAAGDIRAAYEAAKQGVVWTR
jgi:hypothetical protein